ncbi:Holliday junction resolvase RuvX [Nocardiopsis coralliicola]
MRHGVRIAVDPGGARIGVAACDPAGLIATPVETVRRGTGDIDRITELVLSYEAREVVIGLPASLSGAEGSSARLARRFAAELAAHLAPVPVRLVDERLTSVTARQHLHSGASFRGKGAKGGRERRSVIDQAAATVLLQGALDAERSAGRPPGEIVEVAR